jgi:hypothetical protein
LLTIHTGTVMTCPNGFRTSYENITPARAAEMLTANVNNVPVSKRKVGQYTSDLLDGLWRLIPGNIAFSRTGVLMNGQHRLHAIIQSGVTLENYEVKSGYEMDNVASIDPDKPAWNHIKRRGGQYAKVSASAAKLAINWLAERNLNSVPSKVAISNFVIDHPWLQEVAGYAEQAKRVVPAGILAAVMFLSTKDGKWREKVVSFVAGLTDDPDTFVCGDPRHEFVRWIETVRGERKRVQASDTDVFNALAQAWGAHVEGRTRKHFRQPEAKTAGVEIVGAKRSSTAGPVASKTLKIVA